MSGTRKVGSKLNGNSRNAAIDCQSFKPIFSAVNATNTMSIKPTVFQKRSSVCQPRNLGTARSSAARSGRIIGSLNHRLTVRETSVPGTGRALLGGQAGPTPFPICFSGERSGKDAAWIRAVAVREKVPSAGLPLDGAGFSCSSPPSASDARGLRAPRRGLLSSSSRWIPCARTICLPTATAASGRRRSTRSPPTRSSS